MRRVTKKIVVIFFGIVLMILYCEFLIYYVVIMQCRWPGLQQSKVNSEEVLKVLMVTDLHLLGYRKGNIVDMWRREWQMHRAFNTIITWHNPEVVFVLGDIFDEGEYATNNEFNEYVKRFYEKFSLPQHIKMFILVGNHDIGFHNNISPAHAQRFYDKLNTTTVQFLTLKNNHFVLLNSMAMEGDNCYLCKAARKGLEKISESLDCSQKPGCENNPKIDYSRPILLQHFPMYRLSDAICTEPDAVPWYEKDIAFRLKIDALSKESTDYLATKTKPRAVFGGHTHYGCLVNHKYENESIEFLEYSLPSFSWRNIFTPKYMLVSVTPDEYAVNKCGLPGEHTIAITAVLILFATVYIVKRRI